MKNTFKEYHQFTEKEFESLWGNCLFVLDTNTLLNMYRYSRKTVNDYFKALKELKAKKQLWIPYQVGYEFYENRINVIYEYEGSYDSILSILDKAKTQIEKSYKDHPFLDLKEIHRKVEIGLKDVEKLIKETKSKHPKWMEKDEVLDTINQLFENSIGINYDETELKEIKTEGKKRYADEIPPGFKDDKKPEDKKYGDLIFWYQIIDKAIETKKPIILISGDVKEDWWLEKQGKRLMPLPQLKKEIFDKAGVDFHIYTADRFLKFYDETIDENTILEIKRIRELEELRMLKMRHELIEKEKNFKIKNYENGKMEIMDLIETIERIYFALSTQTRDMEDLNHILVKLNRLRIDIVQTEYNPQNFYKYSRDMEEFSYVLNKILNTKDLSPSLISLIINFNDRLKYLNNRNEGF
ncbi:MAG: PIN domain-containing protein [Candidatus Kapaibacterium sp.]